MKIRYAIAAVFIAVLIGLVPASAQTANPTGEGSTYVIQPDDTLWNIARAYDVTLEQILDANPGLNPYALPIGSEIVLPLDETSAAKGSPDPADPNPAAPLTGTVDYVVQEGDSLWALTYRFNVSFDALLAANPDVNIYAMSIGTVIQIPEQPNVARPIDVPVVEAPPSVLPGEPEVLSAPRISTNAGNASSLLIDEGLEPTPAPFIAPRADEFNITEPEIPAADPVTEDAADSLASAGDPDAAPALPPTPIPALIASDVFPITITLADNTTVDFAQLAINDLTIATFEQAPFTYDLNVKSLGEGLYTLMLVTENTSGVLSSSTFEFEVAALPILSGNTPDVGLLTTKDLPLGIFVNGEQRALDLMFSPETGLQLVQTRTEVVAQESLLDILARPANVLSPELRAALTAPRPELFSVVILIMTLTLIPQGLFTLFYMMYTWNNPQIAEQYRSPRQYSVPQFSFTAILPARREENVIYDTIRAVDNIDYPDHLKEILVMIRDDDDDATIAAARRAVDDIGKHNIHVVTFTDGPKNKPNGLNRGLRASSKDVVCVFDAEDQPHPAIYNVINTVMIRDEADVVQSGVQLMNFKSTWFSALNCLEYFFWFKSGLHAFTRMFGVTPLGGNTVFFKRQWLEKVKGWDETCLTEDADIGLRLTQAGAKIQIVYDEEHATQEETPDSVEQFIKQRTRWNQGFYQVFFKGDWLRMPTLRQKVTALYILLNSLFQALIVLYLPLGVYIMLTQPLPVPVALISWIPIFLLLTQLIVSLVGLGEFTRAYGERMPFLFRLKTILVYYPYQLMLSLSAARAVWRLLTNRSSWEKTAHSNLHRQNTAVAQGSI